MESTSRSYGLFTVNVTTPVEALASSGRAREARYLFERVCGYANDVGLLSEEIDPSTRKLLGDFPQAYTHLGLLGAALSLAPP